jgi:RNA polymerase sigma-70 factor (ECF subfamily)
MSSTHLRLVEAPDVSTPAGANITVELAYRRYAPFAAGLILRITGSRESVEDLVQDVFLLVASKFGTLRQPESAKAWIAATAVNVARGALRKRKLLSRFGFMAVESYEDLAGDSVSPFDRLLIGRVYRALDTLTVEERVAWTLRHLEGEKLERVAQLCRCSLSTAKRRIEAAQLRMQEVVG